jgi:hypothetical protein
MKIDYLFESFSPSTCVIYYNSATAARTIGQIGCIERLPTKVIFVHILLIIRIHKNDLLMCPGSYFFPKHSYDRMFHFSYLHEGMASLTSLVRCYVDYILFYCPANVATSNYGPRMKMKRMYIRDRLRLLTKHLQHESIFCNICLKADEIFGTYVCNVCI